MSSGNFRELSRFTRNNNQNKQSRDNRSVVIAVILAAVIASGLAAFYFSNQSQSTVSSTNAQQEILPDSWLIRYFGTDDENSDLVRGAYGDPDGDILTNFQEFYFSTDPTNPDTDGDGQSDGAEIAANSNPLGEGEVFFSDFARQTADRFLEANYLEEFKQENIEKDIQELLQVPDPEDVEIPLPDSNTLLIGTDTSDEAVERYLVQTESIATELELTPIDLLQMLEENRASDLPITIGAIYEAIDRLRETEVPVPFLNIHQLQIAALFSTARVFELSQQISTNIDLREQAPQLREQINHVAIIEKSGTLIDEDIERLSQDYGSLIEKYL